MLIQDEMAALKSRYERIRGWETKVAAYLQLSAVLVLATAGLVGLSGLTGFSVLGVGLSDLVPWLAGLGVMPPVLYLTLIVLGHRAVRTQMKAHELKRRHGDE